MVKIGSVFCTNCGSEWYLSELKMTICPSTNHVKGICPECNWDEFSPDDDIAVEEIENYEKYPEPKFYVEAV